MSSTPPLKATNWFRPQLFLLALLMVTALVYWPGLSGGFIFDDYPTILTNPAIRIEAFNLESLRTAANGFAQGEYGRPLATVSFALDYSIGKYNPWGYKLTSLLVHLVNALLVFVLLKNLLSRVWPHAVGATYTLAAFTVALAWATHPLQVSTVLYVVQRMETLSATFVLLALLAYWRGRTAQCNGQRGWPWLVLSPLLAGIGMLSKETAVLFPVYALALEWTMFRFEPRGSRESRGLKLLYAAGAFAALLVFVVYLFPKYAGPDAFIGREFTLHERLLTQLRVLPMYIGQSVLPLPGTLPFYYDDYLKSSGWLSPVTTLLGGVFLLALLVAAWMLRKRRPLITLGIAWFFAAHLLTSNIFNLELAFEHRNYLALLGLLLVLADLVRSIPTRDGPAIKRAGIAAVLVGFFALAIIRSATWGDPFLLATDLAARNPRSPRAATDLGEQYMMMSGMDANSPFYDMAVKEYERAARLPGASPLPETGLLLMAAASNAPARQEWWDSLIEKIRTRPLGPQERTAMYGLLQQRYDGVKLDDKQLTRALLELFARTKVPPRAYADFGNYLLTYPHDEALAEQMYVRAITATRDADFAAETFATLTADGHTRQAKAVYEKARALGLIGSAGPDPKTVGADVDKTSATSPAGQ
ncbi:ArnT family glycosyltransferase [Lysobacter sp. GCM10012299]|uniref:ArnT family glycosyltransferase n=1 Tax=Lysobacter sp. GCM10012299 TaxID=3317333 RepID=UPI00360F5E2A